MEDCKDTLTFDTATTKTDFSALHSMLSLVTANNYIEAREKWGISIPDYFAGDYDSFQRKRSQFTDLFTSSNITIAHGEHFRRALSPDARANYATCIASKDNLPVAAWVDSFDHETVVIKIANRMVDTTVEINVVGKPQPTESPARLGTNSDQALEFPWDSKQGASITFNVKNATTGNQLRSTTVNIPPLRRIEQRTEYKTLSGTVALGAGGYGSTTENQIYGNTSIVAPPNFSILPETIAEASRTGFGLIRTDVKWIPEVVDGRVARLNSQIGMSEADQGATQRPMTFTYTVESVRKYLVESESQ